MIENLEQMRCDSKDLATLFGLGLRSIQGMAKTRVIPWIDEGPYEFFLVEAVNAYVESLKAKIGQKNISSDDELQRRKQVADVIAKEKEAEIKTSKAELSALELEEYKGNLHHSEDVEEAMEEIVKTAKQGILSFRNKLQNKMADELGVEISVCGDLIRIAQDEVLTDLYSTKYDVNFFKRRSEERLKHEEEQKEKDTLIDGSDE